MARRYDGRRQPLAQIFVAACSGSARLSTQIGLPLVLVDVALDPEAAIDRLNVGEHGSGVRTERMFQPILFDTGWNDWKAFHYKVGQWPGRSSRPEGVRVVDGRILISLPGSAPSELREQLQAVLRHRRLQEVTSTLAFMEARSAELAASVVHPRYSPNPGDLGFRGATICNDLYVLDPAEDPWSLYWAAVTAREATIEGRRP